MLFLKILCAVIIGVILVLCIPVTVLAQYDEKFEVKIKYLFLSLRVFPAGEKKKKPKKKKKKQKPSGKPTAEKSPAPKKKKTNPLLEFYNNSGFSGTLKLIRDVAGIVKKYLGSLFVRHLVVGELFLELDVAGKDSADVAEKFGKISAGVCPSLAFLQAHLKIKSRDITIRPDFLGEKSVAKFRVKLRFKPFWLLNSTIYAAVKLLVQFIKVAVVNSNAKKVKKKYIRKSTEE